MSRVVGSDTVRWRPERARSGMERVKGRNMPMMALKRERQRPNGSHMKMARAEIGVGFRANLPSWKMSGFG